MDRVASGLEVASPYGQQHNLAGVEGWKQLYRDYRQQTDSCLKALAVPRLMVETSAGEWSNYQTQIRTFFDLPSIPEPGWQTWFYKLYDYFVDIR